MMARKKQLNLIFDQNLWLWLRLSSSVVSVSVIYLSNTSLDKQYKLLQLVLFGHANWLKKQNIEALTSEFVLFVKACVVYHRQSQTYITETDTTELESLSHNQRFWSNIRFNCIFSGHHRKLEFQSQYFESDLEWSWFFVSKIVLTYFEKIDQVIKKNFWNRMLMANFSDQ